MALPSSRNTNYAPGVKVKSADLNDLQDRVIADYEGTAKHAERTIELNICDGNGNSAAGFDIQEDSLFTGSGGAEWSIPVKLRPGQRLKSVEVAGVFSDDVRVRVYRRNGVTSETEIGDSGAGGTPRTVSSIDTTAVSGDRFWVYITDSGSGAIIYVAKAVIDFP